MPERYSAEDLVKWTRLLRCKFVHASYGNLEVSGNVGSELFYAGMVLFWALWCRNAFNMCDYLTPKVPSLFLPKNSEKQLWNLFEDMQP